VIPLVAAATPHEYISRGIVFQGNISSRGRKLCLPPPGGRGCRYAPAAADASIKFTGISRDSFSRE